MRSCQNSCPKLRAQASAASSSVNAEEAEKPHLDGAQKDAVKGIINNRRSPSQSQKSVQIAGVAAVQKTDSQSTKSSDKSVPIVGVTAVQETDSRSTKSSTKSDSRSQENRSPVQQISQVSERSSKNSEMSSRDRASPSAAAQGAQWDPNSHDPCPPTCPMAMARERAAKKAQMRQERLDDYLLNKGFSYFDDLCTCTSICVYNQLRRDKFVIDVLKAACLFGLGIKLCEELDAWNAIE